MASIGSRVRRRPVPCAMLVLLGSFTGGCFSQTAPAHLVQLTMSPVAATSPTASAPAPIVSVSLLYSTPWLWLPTNMEAHTAVPYDSVRIDRIEFVRPDRPTLYVPREGSWMIWPFLFVKSEQVACAIFRPGYELAFQGAGRPAGIEWNPEPFMGRAIITARPLVASGSIGASEDGYAHLMANRPFWRALQERYDAGSDREAIRVICDAMVREAQHRRLIHPAETRSADESRTVEWCRSVIFN